MRSHFNPNFVFGKDQLCIQHDLWYSLHDNPEECDECEIEAIDTLLGFEQLSDVIAVYPTRVEYRNWNTEHAHEWYTMGWSIADWDWDDGYSYWSFPSEDACAVPGCDCIRKLPKDFYWADKDMEVDHTFSS